MSLIWSPNWHNCPFFTDFSVFRKSSLRSKLIFQVNEIFESNSDYSFFPKCLDMALRSTSFVGRTALFRWKKGCSKFIIHVQISKIYIEVVWVYLCCTTLIREEDFVGRFQDLKNINCFSTLSCCLLNILDSIIQGILQSTLYKKNIASHERTVPN